MPQARNPLAHIHTIRTRHRLPRINRFILCLPVSLQPIHMVSRPENSSDHSHSRSFHILLRHNLSGPILTRIHGPLIHRSKNILIPLLRRGSIHLLPAKAFLPVWRQTVAIPCPSHLRQFRIIKPRPQVHLPGRNPNINLIIILPHVLPFETRVISRLRLLLHFLPTYSSLLQLPPLYTFLQKTFVHLRRSVLCTLLRRRLGHRAQTIRVRHV
ncbi:hypothetical protein JB92DRAFT_1948809 [Gautieria morchelliformis]|nr:hypothetical protein JB92DRAFT_1948809 [Gautieria morchelliformis]